jgi:hypothetical protein
LLEAHNFSTLRIKVGFVIWGTSIIVCETGNLASQLSQPNEEGS